MKDRSHKTVISGEPGQRSDLGVKNASPEAGGRHKLATIMFSDICGFTKLMGEDEKRAMQVVEYNREIHQRCLRHHNGVLIKEMGDGLLASFESAHDAVRCAGEIMEEVREAGICELHMGIHLGDIIFTKEDIYGDGVNIASRLNNLARAGEILMSHEVWKIISNPPEFSTQYLGQRVLKNVARPIKMYKLLVSGEKAKFELSTVYYGNKKTILTVLSISLVFLVALVVYYRSPLAKRFLPDDIQTIAIIPFENRTNNGEYEYLSEGLAEDVISQLFDLGTITVISSRSSFQYKNSDKSILQISKELRADIILTGNYEIVENQLQVKFELVEGRNNNILDYDILTGQFDKINIVSAGIGQALFKTLQLPVEKSDQAGWRNLQNLNIEAYKLNAQGRSAMYDHTGQDRQDIIQYFEKAIALDSSYAEPYLGIAEAYIFDVNRGYISPVEAAQKARRYALLAEQLEPGRGEISALLGVINLFNGQYDVAATYFEQALQLSPNYYLTYHYYAMVFILRGDLDKAMSLQKKANTIDPLNIFNDVYIVVNYLFQGKLAEANKIIDGKLKMDPDHSLSLWMKALLLNQEYKYEEALVFLEKRKYGLTTNFVAGYTYAMLGREEEARSVLNNMLKSSEKGYVPPSHIAIVYCGLNEIDKAIEQVEEAYLVNDAWTGYLKYTTFTDRLKEHPQYVAIMANLARQ